MSNFKCDKCGTTLIDCGLGVFKTPREIELEARVKELEKIINRLSKKVNAPYTLDDFISITKLQRKLEIANELINLILSFKKVEKYEHIRTFAEQAKEQMKEIQ